MPAYFINIKKPFIVLLLFLIIGFSSWLVTSKLQLRDLISVLLFLILSFSVAIRVITIKLKGKIKTIVLSIGLATIAFFAYTLILSTGGISSPFLVITHLFAIGISFLISPGVSVAFILATISVLTPHAFIDPAAKDLLSVSPFVTVIYMIAYVALIPMSFALAREYRIKEEWVKNLEKQIATSKNQEDALLKNIEDAVLVLNKKFEIMYLNQSVTKLFKYTNHALGKNFFSLFLIKDRYGRPVEKYNMPFEQTINSKIESYIESIQIASENQTYTRVDLKILPVIEGGTALGLVLVIKDLSAKTFAQDKEKNVALIALSRFVSILNKQKLGFQKLIQSPRKTETIKELIYQNIELENLSQDFFYTLRLESGEIGSLSSLVDLGQVLEEIIANEKWRSMEQGIRIIPKNMTPGVIEPRSSLQVSIPTRRFEQVYILANAAWLKDSLGRLLEIIILLTKQGQNVVIDVARQDVLATVTITSLLIIQKQDFGEIFTKFYGRLANLPHLVETSGLEGFIAKNLIERLGGNISFENNPKSELTTVKITFTLIESKLDSTQTKPYLTPLIPTPDVKVPPQQSSNPSVTLPPIPPAPIPNLPA